MSSKNLPGPDQSSAGVRVGVVMLLFVVGAAFVVSRLSCTQTEKEEAVAEVADTLCLAIVHGGGYEAVVEEAREAVRMAPGNPEALFRFQVSQILIGEYAGIEDEQQAQIESTLIAAVAHGEFQRARDGVTAMLAAGHIRSGRADLWMDLIGDMELATATNCGEGSGAAAE